MTPTLNDVLNELATVEADGAAQFDALARAIQRGEKPSTAEVKQVLDAAGKTANDLAALVRLLQSRDALRQKIRDAKEAGERIAQLRAKIEEHNAELERHVAAHQAACQPLQYEIAQCNATILAATTAESELMHTCGCENLKAQAASLNHQLRQLAALIDARDHALHGVRAQVGTSSYSIFPDEKARVDAAVKRLENEIAELHRQRTEIIEQRNAVSQRMKEW